MADAIVKVYYGNLMMLPDVSRVLTCLHEKNIKFDLINMSKGQHSVPFDFLKLQENSSSRVLGPVFDDGSKMLFESREICRYLPENYAEQGNKYLLGINTLDRASIEQWIRSEKHSFDPPSWNLVFHLAFASFMDLEPKRALIQESERKLSEVLDVYNQRLADSKFLAGNNFTLADLVHLPNAHYLANSKEWSYLFTSRKNVKKWWKKISQRESWLHTIQRINEVGNEERSTLVSSSSKGNIPRKSQVFSAKITELPIDDHISSPSKLEVHQPHVLPHNPEAFQSPKKHKRKKASEKPSKVAPHVSPQTEASRPSKVPFDQPEEKPLKKSKYPIHLEPDYLSIPQSKILPPWKPTSSKPTSELEPSDSHNPPEIPFLEIESPNIESILPKPPTDLYPPKPENLKVEKDNHILIEPTSMPIYQSNLTFEPQRSPPTHKKETQPEPEPPEKLAASIPPVHIPNLETRQFYEQPMHPQSNETEHLHQTQKSIEDEVSQPHIFYSQNVPSETKYYKLEPPKSSIQYIQKITTTPVENTTPTEPTTKENPNQKPKFPVPLESAPQPYQQPTDVDPHESESYIQKLQTDTSYYKIESPRPSQENIEKSTGAIHESEAHGSDQTQPAKQSREIEFQQPPQKNTERSTKETSPKLAPFMPTQSEYVPYSKQPTVPHLGKTGIPQGSTLNTINLEPTPPIPPEAQVSASKRTIDPSSHIQATTSQDQTPPIHQPKLEYIEPLKKEFTHAPLQPSIPASQPKDFRPSQAKNGLPYPKSEDNQFIQYLDQIVEFDPSRKNHPSIIPQKEDLELIGTKDKISHQKPPEPEFSHDSREKREKLSHKKAQDNPFSRDPMEKREGHILPESSPLPKSTQLEPFKPLPKPVELETNTPLKQPNALQSPKAKNDLAYPNAENTEISNYLKKKKKNFISEEPGETSSINLPKKENSKMPKHTDKTSHQKPLDPLLSQDSKEKRAHLSLPEPSLLKSTQLEPLNRSLNSPESKSKAYLQPSEIKNDLPYSDSEDIQILQYLDKKKADLHPLGPAIPSVISEEDSNFFEPTVEISHQKSLDQPPSQEPREKRANLILPDSTVHKLTQLEHLQVSDELLESKADDSHQPPFNILPHELDAHQPHEKSYKSDLHKLEPPQHSHDNLEPFILDHPKFIPQEEDDKLYKPASDIKFPGQDESYLAPESKENKISLSPPSQDSSQTTRPETLMISKPSIDPESHKLKSPEPVKEVTIRTETTSPESTTQALSAPEQKSLETSAKTTHFEPFSHEKRPPQVFDQQNNALRDLSLDIQSKERYTERKEATDFVDSTLQPILLNPQPIPNPSMQSVEKITPVTPVETTQPTKPKFPMQETDEFPVSLESSPQSMFQDKVTASQQPTAVNPHESLSYVHKPHSDTPYYKIESSQPSQENIEQFTGDIHESEAHGSDQPQLIRHARGIEFQKPKLKNIEPFKQSLDSQTHKLEPLQHGQKEREKEFTQNPLQPSNPVSQPKDLQPSQTKNGILYPESEDTQFIEHLDKINKFDPIRSTSSIIPQKEDSELSGTEDKTNNQKPLEPPLSQDSKENRTSLNHQKPQDNPMPEDSKEKREGQSLRESSLPKITQLDLFKQVPKPVESETQASLHHHPDTQPQPKNDLPYPDSEDTEFSHYLKKKKIDFISENAKMSEPIAKSSHQKPLDPSLSQNAKKKGVRLSLPESSLKSTQLEPLDTSPTPPKSLSTPSYASSQMTHPETLKSSEPSIDAEFQKPKSQEPVKETKVKTEATNALRDLPQDVQSVERHMEKKEATDFLDSTLQSTQKEVISPLELPIFLSNQPETPQPVQSSIEKISSAPPKQIIEPSKLPKGSIPLEPDVPQPPKNTLETPPLSTQAKAPQPHKPLDEKEEEPNTSQLPLLPTPEDGANQPLKPSIDSYMQKKQVPRVVKNYEEEIISSTMKPSRLPTSQSKPSRQTQTPVKEILGESASHPDQTEPPLIQEGFQDFQPRQQVKSSPIDTQQGFPKPAQEPLEKKETSTPQSIIIPKTQPEIDQMNIKNGPSKVIKGINEKGEETNNSKPPLLPTQDDGANQPFKPSTDLYMQKQQVQRIVKSSLEETISSTMKPSHLPTSQSEPSQQTQTPLEEILGESTSQQDQAETPLIQEEFQPLQLEHSSPIDTQLGFPEPAQELLEKKETSTPRSIIIPKTQPEINPMNIKSRPSKVTTGTNEKGEEPENSKQPLLPTPNDGANQPFKPSTDSYTQKQQVQRIVKSSVEETISSSNRKLSHLLTSQSEPSKPAQTPVEEILGESASQPDQAETSLIQEEFQPLQRVQSSPIDTQHGFPKPAQEPLEKKETSTPQSIIIPSTQPEIDPTDIKSEPSKATESNEKEEANTSKPPLLPTLDDGANQRFKPSLTDSYKRKQEDSRVVKHSVEEIISSSTMKPSQLPSSQSEPYAKTQTPIEEILGESSSQTDRAEPPLIQEGFQPFQQVQALDTMKPTPEPIFQSEPPKRAQTAIEKVVGQSPSKPTQMEAHFRQEDPQPLEQEPSSMTKTSKQFKSTQKSIEGKQISPPEEQPQSSKTQIGLFEFKTEPSNPPQGPKENIESSNIPQQSLSTPKDEDHKLSEKQIETPKKEPKVSDHAKSSLDETTSSPIVNPPVLPFSKLESPKQTQTSTEKEVGQTHSQSQTIQTKPLPHTQGVPRPFEEVSSLTETQKEPSVPAQKPTEKNATSAPQSIIIPNFLPKGTSSSTKPIDTLDIESKPSQSYNKMEDKLNTSQPPSLPTPQNEANQPSKLPIDSSSMQKTQVSKLAQSSIEETRAPALKTSQSNTSQDLKPTQTSTEKIVSRNTFQSSEIALPSQEKYPQPLGELVSSATTTPKEAPLAQNYPKPTPTETQTDDKPSSIDSPLFPQSPPPKRSQSPQPPTSP